MNPLSWLTSSFWTRTAPRRPARRRPVLEALERRDLLSADLRIVTYNVANYDTAQSGRGDMGIVLQAIGDEPANGVARPIDVLALQEVSTNQSAASSPTQQVLAELNGIYGAGTYSYVNFSGATIDGDTQGLIYRVSTVQVLGQVGVGTASTAGSPRQPIRYNLRPVGFGTTNDFYLYNSHYKASNTQPDRDRRLVEAQAIRANADALPQGTNILYVGDFNTYNSSEAGYTHLLGAGNGQGFDPINTPGSWTASSGFAAVHTQSPTLTAIFPGQITGGMDDRFDFQLVSNELTNGVGLDYLSGSYRPFGNNGSSFNSDITTSTIWNSSSHPLFATRTTILGLRSSSDHLPVVADYDIITSTPTVTFTAASQSGAENAATLTVTAQLSATTGSAVTVPFTLSGTATGGGPDYTITASPITIPANQLTGTVTITLNNDALDEGNETVIVTMGTPTNATLGATTVHTATITDDDPTPTVTFTAASQSAAEGVGTMTVTAQLSAVSGLPVTVPFTLSGTATGGGPDYTITASPITIAAGQASGAITISVVNDTSAEPSETVVVTMGAPTNATQGATTAHTATITDNDAPAVLQVAALTPTPSGFTIDFNRQLNPADLNLYDAAGALGAADVAVTGPGGAVSGSLVVDPGLTRATFVRTGGVLADGAYTVTLRSAADGFKDAVGGLLDGDANGTAGGDYATAFSVASSARSVGVPDFARGFGQPVVVPATGTGLPLRLSDGAGVTGVVLDLAFEPTLLLITGASVAAGTPAGATASLTVLGSGLVRVTFASPTALAAGAVDFVSLTASVPNAAPYAAKQILDVRGLSVNGGAIASRDDDAVHVAGYLGDADGNQAYGAQDATRAAQVAAQLNTGFTAYQLADPAIVADVSGDGAVGSADITRIARKAAQLAVPEIPDLPTGIAPPAVGLDPRLYFADGAAAAGSRAALSLRMEVTDPLGIRLESGTLTFRFDPTRLRVLGVSAGAMIPGFRARAKIDNVRGVVIVRLDTDGPLDFAPGADGELVRIAVAVRGNARAGASPLNLLAGYGTARTELNGGTLILIPAPTDAADDPENDGTFTVTRRPAHGDLPVRLPRPAPARPKSRRR